MEWEANWKLKKRKRKKNCQNLKINLCLGLLEFKTWKLSIEQNRGLKLDIESGSKLGRQRGDKLVIVMESSIASSLNGEILQDHS